VVGSVRRPAPFGSMLLRPLWSKRFGRILTDDGAGRFRSSSSAVARQPAVTYKTERTEVERAQRRGEGGERRGPAPLSIRPFTA
jgi:hypothetical protein